MMKLHQIYSGTVKFESGASQTLDLSKAKFIQNNLQEKRLVYFTNLKKN